MKRSLARFAGTLLAALGLAACAPGPGSLRSAWEQPLPPVRVGPIVDSARLHRTTLENGLRVLVLEDPRLPRVGLSVTVRRGAGIVPPRSAGLATFTAELLERGAGARDALALAEAVDSLGASLAASADRDSMSVSVTGLSRDLDALLEILADVVLRPRFDAEEAAKVRAELLGSLEQSRDEPAILAGWHLARLLYPDHPYGVPVDGTPEAVAGLDAAAASTFHEQVFTARNAVFSAWGDLEAPDLIDRVESAFGGWEPGEVPDPGPPPPARTPEERRVLLVDLPDRGQAQIVLGHEGMARREPERLAALIMNTALGGGGFTSRLMTTVRAEEGLTYGIYSYFSLRRHPGPFVVATSTRAPEVRRVIDLIFEALEQMRDAPPQAEEFRRVQTLSAGRFALGLETSAAVANSLVELDVAGLPEDSLDTYRARVAALRERDVAEAAGRWLHPERVAIVVAGPAEVIRPQLEGLGALEVVAP